MIATSVAHGVVDVITMVRFLLSQNISGMKAAVFWLLILKTFQKLFTILSESNKLIPYRFEAIAYLAGAMDLVVVKLDP